MNGEKRAVPLWKGAMLLSLAALLTKGLSAVYRIPFQNIAGDVGFYVYQQVYPFYAIAFVLSTYGFPVVISKYLSEKTEYNENEKEQMLALFFYTLLFISIATFLLLFALAPLLAFIMGDEKLTLPLTIAAFAFLAMPFLSTFRGYFQGKGDMLPSASSQMMEQGVRVVFILLLTFLFIANGYGSYGAGSGAALGSIIGMKCSILLLYFYFKKEGKTIRYYPVSLLFKQKVLLQRFVKDSFLFSMSALILIAIQLVDSLTVLRFLQMGGVEEHAAKVLKGIYDRGQPLLQLGTTIATAIALTVVPLIANLKGKETAREYGELALRLTMTFGLCATMGLIVIIEPANAMLFTNREGALILAVFSLSIFFSSVVMVTAAILQGYDVGKVAARHITIGLFVKVVLNVVLIPMLNVYGAAISTVAGLALITILNVAIIYKKNIAKKTSVTFVLRLSAVVLIMAAVTFGWKEGLEQLIFTSTSSRLHETVIALSSVFLGIVVAFYTVIKFRLFSEQEVAPIPILKKLFERAK